MNICNFLIKGVFYALLISSVYTELKSRKILNVITFPTILIGIILNSCEAGMKGMLQAIYGIIVGASILLIPFMMGQMGAGDIKMLAAIGSLKGPSFAFWTGICGIVVGGLIALGYMLFYGTLWTNLKRFYSSLYTFLTTGKVVFPEFVTTERYLPFGIALALGTFHPYLTIILKL